MDKYIYNQRSIPKDKWRYGLRTSAATGCGWIAIYNAMNIMGCPVKIEELIRQLERQVPLLHGNAGTLAPAPYFWFKKQGFRVEITGKKQDFDRVLNRNDCALLFYYWKKGLRIGSHFIAVRSTPEGIIGYNVYVNSTGEDFLGKSLPDWIDKSHHFGCILIGVSNAP